MGYQYERVPWEKVAELAAQGWRLMEIPPMPEMQTALGQMQMTGKILFFMERDARHVESAGPGPVARTLLR